MFRIIHLALYTDWPLRSRITIRMTTTTRIRWIKLPTEAKKEIPLVAAK